MERKTRIVLSVLAGGMSVAEAARREKVGAQSIGWWEAEFLEGSWRPVRTVLVAGRSGPWSREERLEAEVAELTWALGEAHLEVQGVEEVGSRAGCALRGPLEVIGVEAGEAGREVLPAFRHARGADQGVFGRKLARQAAKDLVRKHALAHPAVVATEEKPTVPDARVSSILAQTRNHRALTQPGQ